MSAKQVYTPPYSLTANILNLVAGISERVGRLSALAGLAGELRLRRINRIRSIQGSLAIEGNTLSEHQITALLDGRRVIAPPRELREARNAIAAYDRLGGWDPMREEDLLEAHRVLMAGLMDGEGEYRTGGVGVMDGATVVHMAPPARRVPVLMRDLLQWLATTDGHPLVASSVFHYEFEFIHPFTDGNGRMGRMWQTLMLARWNPVFWNIPVESLVHARQAGYYRALQVCNAEADSTRFIEFMLETVLEAVVSTTPQVAPQVTPQVGWLLVALQGEMSGAALQRALRLKDRKSFQQRHLAPALAEGLVERTLPDRPRSRLQKYRLSDSGKMWVIQQAKR